MQAIRCAASKLSSWKFREMIASIEEKIDHAVTCDDWIKTLSVTKHVRQRMNELMWNRCDPYVFFTEWCIDDVLAMFIFSIKNSCKEMLIVISGGSEECIQEKCSEAHYLFPGSHVFAGRPDDLSSQYRGCEWILRRETPRLDISTLVPNMFGMIFIFGSEDLAEEIAETHPDIFDENIVNCKKQLGGPWLNVNAESVLYASEEHLFGNTMVSEIIDPVSKRLREFPEHPVYKWFVEKMDAGGTLTNFDATLCVMCWSYMGDYNIPEERGYLIPTSDGGEVWKEDETSRFTYTIANNHAEQIEKFVEKVLFYLHCNDETTALFYMELFDSFDPILGKHDKFGDMALHLEKRFKYFREHGKPFNPEGRCDLALRLARAYVGHAIKWLQVPDVPDMVKYYDEFADPAGKKIIEENFAEKPAKNPEE